MSGFYEFEHECEAMPEDVKFCKINGCSSSQFTIDQRTRGVALLTAVLYGFRFCPYCGEDMEVVKR